MEYAIEFIEIEMYFHEDDDDEFLEEIKIGQKPETNGDQIVPNMQSQVIVVCI